MSESSRPSLIRGLGPMAATSMTVAGVIGTGVFLKARVMTCNVGTPALVLLAWVVAGALSIAGALSYAELAAMMPEAGGEYVFLRRAYGRLPSFLFGWMRFFIAGSGGAAALASGLGIFLNVVSGGALAAHEVHPFGPSGIIVTGVGMAGVLAIVAVTLINCAAVRVGGQVASTMAVAKVVLIVGLGVAALVFGSGSWDHFMQSGLQGVCEGVPSSARGGLAGFGAAMLAALWAYNGWNETSYVAGEVRNPRRVLPFALVGGIGIVAAMYVFVNFAYAYVLPPLAIAGVSRDSSVATEVLARFLGPAAMKAMAAALVVSIFSALQVMTLLGARVPFAMAADGLFFRSLATLSPRTRVPVRVLVLQGAWACVLVLSGSFDALTDYAMFAILAFVGMAAASVFVMRRREPSAERPYLTLGYPLTPALFLGVIALVLVNTLVTAPRQAAAGIGLIALGVPFYAYWTRAGSARLRSPAS